MLRSQRARCSSPDLRLHQTQETASPTPPRSNSFVSSRRTGIVCEQDVLRLASVVAADDDRRAGDQRLPPWTVAAQTAPGPWPAPVLRQRSDDSEQRLPRPLSTGYLPSNSVETQAAQRVQAERCWRQWNSAPQRKGRPFGDVNASTTPENGWRPSQTPRRSGSGRADEQQLLAEREAELRALRSTMERNEAAIFRAMDDQRRAWEAEVAAERESWERRVRDAERQVDDVRVTLTDRIRDLERQNAALQSTNVEHSRGHDTVRARRAVNGREQSVVGSGGRLQQSAVNGVDSRPQNFTPSSTGKTAGGGGRLAADQRRPPPPESDSVSDTSASRLPAIVEAAATTRCRHCEAMSGQLDRLREEFDAERQQWLAEKRRVIAYQKLLQSKYVQLERHCARLEGSTAADDRNHVETAGDVTPTSDADEHAARDCWNSTQASPSLLLPKFASFGQSIET